VGILRISVVLVVRNVIFMSAFLKMLVMDSVSLPVYVKVAQLCFGVGGGGGVLFSSAVGPGFAMFDGE
jgi:hypothetical protein